MADSEQGTRGAFAITTIAAAAAAVAAVAAATVEQGNFAVVPHTKQKGGNFESTFARSLARSLASCWLLWLLLLLLLLLP